MADRHLGWSITDACEEFEKQGMPVDKRRFTMAVSAFQLTRIGEKKAKPGSKGGRGQALYEIGQLQRLHSQMVDWQSRRVV